MVATAVHDVSDGGLLVALAEMATASGIGADVMAPTGVPPHAFWFGEDQARYVVTVREDDAQNVINRAAAGRVPVTRLGHTGGDAVAVSGSWPVLLSTLSRRHESWFPDYMLGTDG
jgi:phosphoribosylformylglycinamidine synthase subunit PurL